MIQDAGPALRFAVATAVLGVLPSQSLLSYGAGTPGSGGVVPRIWGTGTPRPGNASFGVTIDRGRPNSPAIAFVSTRKADVSVAGVRVLVDLSASIPLPPTTLDARGEGAYSLPIPNNPALLGASVVQQAFVADAGGGALGVSATQGLDVQIRQPGMLVAHHQSPFVAIDLGTGALTTFTHPSQTHGQVPGFFGRQRTHMLVGSDFTRQVSLFDCRVFPPRYEASFSATRLPSAVAYHPDGLRAYVLNATLPASVQVVWGTPGAPNFGRPHPGGGIAVTSGNPGRLLFTSTGDVGVLAFLGLFGGHEIQTIDTRAGSPTYHTVTGRLSTGSDVIHDVCRIDDRLFAILAGPLATAPSLLVVDIRTMTQVQYHASQSFGVDGGALVSDPLGRYVYATASSPAPSTVTPAILRVNVDSADPNYGRVLSITAGIPAGFRVRDLAISDAGDRLFVIAFHSTSTSYRNDIIELDTATLRMTRSWSPSTPVTKLALR